MTRRVIAPERLDFVDVVLATHGHTDHLDPETLPHVGGTLVAPAGIADLARERSRPRAGDAERGRVGRGRRLLDRGRARRDIPGAHCVGYVIDGRIYHAGDTEAIDPPAHDVELALVPINGKVDNMDGVEAARLAHAMRAGLAVPMHVEMFEFNTASPDAFVARVRAARPAATACSARASGSTL